jgi:hypothetical protein
MAPADVGTDHIIVWVSVVAELNFYMVGCPKPGIVSIIDVAGGRLDLLAEKFQRIQPIAPIEHLPRIGLEPLQILISSPDAAVRVWAICVGPEDDRILQTILLDVLRERLLLVRGHQRDEVCRRVDLPGVAPVHVHGPNRDRVTPWFGFYMLHR